MEKEMSVWGVFLKLMPTDEHLELMSVHKTHDGAKRFVTEELRKTNDQRQVMPSDFIPRDDEHWFVHELTVKE
jgi:hypothetical protein